jgi:PAS domain S-box-containing protein
VTVLTVHSVVPQPDEVGAFLQQLRARREKLLALTQTGTAPAGAELGRAIDEIGEQLLVADEELRVQSEHLEESTRRLDLLVAAYEELFANAPVAYVQTDADGLVLRMNRAAARLLALSTVSRRSRTLPGLLRPADRGPVRQALTRLRTAAASSFAAAHEPIEAAVVRPDGTEVPVVLTARRSREAETGRMSFHWELQEHGSPATAAATAPERAVRPAVTMMAEVAAELARQESPAEALAQVVVRARQALSHCDDVGVLLMRSRHRLQAPAQPEELAAACDRLQHELREGPGLTAVETGMPAHCPDLAHDRRWPRFGRLAARGGIRSVIAVPLAGQRGVAGVLSFYARHPGAFTDEDVLVAQAFGTHAAIALAHVELESNLRIGLATREEIGRAVGILMERHRVTAQDAFDMLVAASQQSQRKLRDIAAWLNETGEDPSTLTAGS